MNVYVLKGVLLDAANSPGTASTLKDRVFDAISFPGFINSTYDVIGVEFGLGIMDLADHHSEPAVVKIQIWNLNEGKGFILNWRHFLKGSRFAVITFHHPGGNDFSALETIIKDCVERCPDINIGVVILAPDGVANVENVPALIEKHFNKRADLVQSLDVMMNRLVTQCLDSDHAACVLPITSEHDLQHVAAIQNPFFTYLARVSENLMNILHQQKIQVEENHVLLESPEYKFRINLNNASLHVASKQCTGCKDFPCRESYAKICVVLDSQVKRGFSSDDLGLTASDLFVLAMIFAISSSSLPTSVTSQFPKSKPCIRRK
jgi:hypothetical protein